MTGVNACAVCGGKLKRVKAWLKRCNRCGFYFSELTPGAGTGIEGLESLRRANFEDLLDRLEHHMRLPNANVLEVGCGCGWFLEAASRRGAHLSALEPEDANAAMLRAKGFDVRTGFFPDSTLNGKHFDSIVFNDVFEHLPDPAAAIRATERALSPGGLVVINLPSSDGIIFRVAAVLDRLGLHEPYDRLWQKGLPSPHISYFNRRTLDRLIRSQTALEAVDWMSLASLNRQGLRERITSTTSGAVGEMAFAGAWLLSWIETWLPADILVGFFRKPSH